MIRYIPVRGSISASVKEEQTFPNQDAMLAFSLDRATRFLRYVGSDAVPQITFGAPAGEDPRIGWKTVQSVFVGRTCVGYCDTII